MYVNYNNYFNNCFKTEHIITLLQTQSRVQSCHSEHFCPTCTPADSPFKPHPFLLTSLAVFIYPFCMITGRICKVNNARGVGLWLAFWLQPSWNLTASCCRCVCLTTMPGLWVAIPPFINKLPTPMHSWVLVYCSHQYHRD